MHIIVACPCTKICVWVYTTVGLGVCLYIPFSYLLGTYYVPGTVSGSGNVTSSSGRHSPSPGCWGDSYETNTHMGDCRWKCGQQGKGMPAEPRGQGRHPELSSEGRERSFLGRGTGPCKGQEVGRNGKAEKQPELGGEGEPGQAR